MRETLLGILWGVFSFLTLTIDGSCQLPHQWSGRWFQSGVQQIININTTTVETKGECLENEGDKFVIEDKLESCFRCVVIHEKHPNVLQYKETYCDERHSLDAMCAQITGDAPLFSMLRAEPIGGPVSCPFKGPFDFTYNRGSGECFSPVSQVDACTDESRLLLRYQACPDVHSTEATVEELVCLASWKEGSTRYLVGKLYHKTATSDEDRYRCFVYEHRKRDGHIMYDVAQSGDATCNGLLSATEGSRTMKLKKVENQHVKCQYPSWVTDHHHWHTLDYKLSYHFSHKNATLRISNEDDGGQESRVVCHNLEASENSHRVKIIGHATSGCKSGYVCMVFHRREAHIIELQQSLDFIKTPEDVCNSVHLNQTSLPYTTLITSLLHPRKCPYLGHYTVTGLSINGYQVTRRKRTKHQETTEPEECSSQDFQSLVVGCSENSNIMEFYSSCNTESVLAYSCHGSWEDNGTSYLIVSPVSRKSVGAHRYCFIYMHVEGDFKRRNTTLQVSSMTESCHRNINPGITGEQAFNLTKNGQCAKTSTSAMSTTIVVVPSLIFILSLTALISNFR